MGLRQGHQGLPRRHWATTPGLPERRMAPVLQRARPRVRGQGRHQRKRSAPCALALRKPPRVVVAQCLRDPAVGMARTPQARRDHRLRVTHHRRLRDAQLERLPDREMGRVGTTRRVLAPGTQVVARRVRRPSSSRLRPHDRRAAQRRGRHVRGPHARGQLPGHLAPRNDAVDSHEAARPPARLDHGAQNGNPRRNHARQTSPGARKGRELVGLR